MRPSDFISAEPKKTKFFTEGFKQGTIEIDNSFQRRGVWVEKDKTALIESVLMGFPIPEIYLWETGLIVDNGDTTYSIVDGQQRTSAIWEFVNNKFALKNKDLDHVDATYAGKKFSELSAEDKTLFWSYNFQVRIIDKRFLKEQISNLFLRLNRTNTSLNPQELRNAKFNGKFIELADNISLNPFWKDFNIFSHADYRRMVDIQIISTLLIFLRSGFSDTGQTAINKIYDEYNDVYNEADEDVKSFENIFYLINELTIGNEYLLDSLKTKVHFYNVFVLCYYITNNNIKADNLGSKLNTWFQKYKNKEYSETGEFSSLEEFAILSQEGSGKKFNRSRRFDIIKAYLFS